MFVKHATAIENGVRLDYLSGKIAVSDVIPASSISVFQQAANGEFSSFN